MARGPAIFKQLGIPDKEREECFFMCSCYSCAGLQPGGCAIVLKNKKTEGHTLSLDRPVYLFAPKPSDVPYTVDFPQPFIRWGADHAIYWSFDELGREAMSENDRKRLRLPQPELQMTGPTKHYWKNYAYDEMSKFQKARGHEGITFAENLKLPILKVITRLEDMEPDFEVIYDDRVEYL
ncbi:hypothetical protein VNI00_003759 [Paramarasmius palmivorus]|uniref:Uncharacterized protein n=1 Tax=Paramarasmius palmivorus TaxID=297713 RepID=A0AAW0DT22_9AGAR